MIGALVVLADASMTPTDEVAAGAEVAVAFASTVLVAGVTPTPPESADAPLETEFPVESTLAELGTLLSAGLANADPLVSVPLLAHAASANEHIRGKINFLCMFFLSSMNLHVKSCVCTFI